ncbi:MAG: VOC family protein [Hellea sp.]|nr:VOC family protein [Hellea sp.]
MKLGAFSVSLAVKDLHKSMEFYEALGFSTFHSMAEHGYAILTNGDATIGLFQDMFEDNILTFNPGWDKKAQPLEDFEDVRAIQKKLQDAGIELTTTCDPDGSGPASITMLDPDGNPVLIDQHV